MNSISPPIVKILLQCVINTSKTLNIFVFLLVLNFQVRYIIYVHLARPTLKTFENFCDYFTTYASNSISRCYFFQAIIDKFDLLLARKFHFWSVNYIYLNGFPKNVLLKSETPFLYPTIKILIFRIIYTNKTLNKFVSFLVLKFQICSVNYVRFTDPCKN